LSRNVEYQNSGQATLHPRRTETSNVPIQMAIKICLRNETCIIYERLRSLSVASRYRLRFHSDVVSSGYVMLYASIRRCTGCGHFNSKTSQNHFYRECPHILEVCVNVTDIYTHSCKAITRYINDDINNNIHTI
jgi:hypothetical protein